MNLQTANRVTKLGIINFWRNRWLSLAATLIMTLTLLIIGIFAILTVVINSTTDSIRNKMDISIYFNDSAPVDNIVDLQQALAARGDVKEVQYVSKEQALEIFKNQQEGKKVANLIDPNENPLPRSLEVKANQAEDLDSIASFVSQDSYKTIVHNVSYQDNKMVIERLISFTSFIKRTGWAFSILFVIISILVVLNTIRLAMFTRKDEIEIMKLVGANDTFIRVPFIIEGVLYGVIATILATVLIRVGTFIASPIIEHYLGIDFSDKLNRLFSGNFLLIIGLELFVGVVIGIVCSLISIRRYLKT